MFVVGFAGCGGWPGLRPGALERWRFSESLGGVGKKVAGWSGGNCEVGCCWLSDGMSGGLRVFQGGFGW